MTYMDFSSIPDEVYLQRSDEKYAEEKFEKAGERFASFGVELDRFEFAYIDNDSNLVGRLPDGRIETYGPDGRKFSRAKKGDTK